MSLVPTVSVHRATRAVALLGFVVVSLAGCKSTNCAPTKAARDEARRGLMARPTARETDEAVRRLADALVTVKDDASDDRTWSMLRESVSRLSSIMSSLDVPTSRERTQAVLAAFQSEKASTVSILEYIGGRCGEN